MRLSHAHSWPLAPFGLSSPAGKETDMEYTFNEWYEETNLHFIWQTGVGADDLPDIVWWAEYDAGTPPENMPRIYAEDYDDTGMMMELFG